MCSHGYWATNEANDHHHHRRGNFNTLPRHGLYRTWATSSERDSIGVNHHHHIIQQEGLCCGRNWTTSPPCYMDENNSTLVCLHENDFMFFSSTSTRSLSLPIFHASLSTHLSTPSPLYSSSSSLPLPSPSSSSSSVTFPILLLGGIS